MKQIKKFYRAKNGGSYLGYWTEPVYDEYRRLNYRLRNQMSIFDFIEKEPN